MSYTELRQNILVVSHDIPLQTSRVAVVRTGGYEVEFVNTDDDAMAKLAEKRFDLVVIGRTSSGSLVPLDKRLRHEFPTISVLKIDGERSDYASRTTGSGPQDVLTSIHAMLDPTVCLSEVG